MRLNDCRSDASTDVFLEYKCFDAHVKNTLTSNQAMKKKIFAADYSEYM